MEILEIHRSVQWRDLCRLSTREMLIENNLTIPWLVLSLLFAHQHSYFAAIPFSAFFFLTALRQVHNGFHQALGTGKRLTWLTFFLNSILMGVSVHAVRFNHLRHHRHCLGEEDYEGKAAGMTWYGALIYGPVHFVLIHWVTWREGSRRDRFNLVLELTSISLVVSLAVYFQWYLLWYHFTIMFLGEMLMAFFAVWTVHHHTHDAPQLARTQRSLWKNRLTFGMFYHLEHHLFPAVPTIKMPELVQRIDEAVPELEKKKTF